jgi:hypothetical protein
VNLNIGRSGWSGVGGGTSIEIRDSKGKRYSIFIHEIAMEITVYDVVDEKDA